MDRRHQLGFCQQPLTLHAAIHCAHHGEEPVLSGRGGAGTVFLTGCTMRCGFCQNFQISHELPQPRWTRSVEQMAQAFLALEVQGCHYIEWVSPTQHLLDLVATLRLARRQGLTLPVVANGNGYERLQVLRMLEGIIDIYVPDAKYGHQELARQYSQTPDYVPVHRRVLREIIAFYGFVVGVGPADHLAHMGGLLMGGVWGFLLPPPGRYRPRTEQLLEFGLGGLSLALVLAAGGLAYAYP